MNLQELKRLEKSLCESVSRSVLEALRDIVRPIYNTLKSHDGRLSKLEHSLDSAEEFKPLRKQVETLVNVNEALRNRVDLLERQMAAMNERYERDMNILLRAEIEKKDPVNNPWRHI